MTDRPMGFDTLAIHAATAPDPATGARQVPIYQTTAYVFRDADHAAKLFNLQEVGYIYSRLTNPTVSALANRVCALEGGAGAIACSSGHAAQIMALFPLMGPGKNIVASSRLYGGTITQFSQTIKRFGWSAKFVDTDDLGAVSKAIDKNTRAIFCETIANPGGYVTDIPALAKIADKKGIPLIVDNTTATPFLCRPIELGATLVVHSATKYLTGNGTVTGGIVVDSGKFNWSQNDKFPSLSQPEPAYHGLTFHPTLGGMAFTFNKVLTGANIGKSLFDEEGAKIVPDIMKKAQERGVKIHIPTDYVIADKFEETANTQIRDIAQGIDEGWMGLDIGPKTIKANSEVLNRAKTVFWNGP
jgi:O-acetylhomoserine (thiol)-lyase